MVGRGGPNNSTITATYWIYNQAFVGFKFGYSTAMSVVLMLFLVILGVLALISGTLTLPGIAGFVLTIGTAVDANVLINERIREELRAGATPQAAIHAGSTMVRVGTALFGPRLRGDNAFPVQS